jgi:hypothetical protein
MRAMLNDGKTKKPLLKCNGFDRAIEDLPKTQIGTKNSNLYERK